MRGTRPWWLTCVPGWCLPQGQWVLTTSENPLRQWGAVTHWSPVSDQWRGGDKVCRHRSSSWGTWESVLEVCHLERVGLCLCCHPTAEPCVLSHGSFSMEAAECGPGRQLWTGMRVSVTAYLLQGTPITENKSQHIEHIEHIEVSYHYRSNFAQ